MAAVGIEWPVRFAETVHHLVDMLSLHRASAVPEVDALLLLISMGNRSRHMQRSISFRIAIASGSSRSAF
jgi:hypothetical protein